MAEQFKTKWNIVLAVFNISNQVVNQSAQALQNLANSEKKEISKEEMKSALEQARKNKPILEEQKRVYEELLKHFDKELEPYRDSFNEIGVDCALEVPVNPDKNGPDDPKKLYLDEKGNYTYSKEGEKKRIAAIKKLDNSDVFIKVLTVTTTIELPQIFDGLVKVIKPKPSARKAPSK